MSTPSVAHRDPAISAVVLARTPLHYHEGADPGLDRPAHVRADSSLAWVPGGIAVVQDDANFLAVHDPDNRRTRSIALPVGDQGADSSTTGGATRSTGPISRRAFRSSAKATRSSSRSARARASVAIAS